MKVFVSWSGVRSKAVATALKDLIPDILTPVDIWMSDADIPAGSRWSHELSRELNDRGFGILCMTGENVHSVWLSFEAGAISASVSQPRVVPYAFGLRAIDLPYPFGQFQGVEANFEGTFRLLTSLNSGLEVGLSEERLRRMFERWWPDFKVKLDAIDKTDFPVARSEREMLEETAALVRDIHNWSNNQNGGSSDPASWLRGRIQQEEAGLLWQRKSEEVNYTAKGFSTPEPFERIMEERGLLIKKLRAALGTFESTK